MSVLFVGSFKINKGQEYTGIIPEGNAFRITEKGVLLSINHTPMAQYPVDFDIINYPTYTYSFNKDATILLTRTVNPDLTIIYEHDCPQTVALVANTESASICSVENLEEILANGGIFSADARVINSANQSRNVIIRLYAGASLIYTAPSQVISDNTTQNFVAYFGIIDPILANTINSFTVEVDGSDCIVDGTRPSIIRIEKTKL